MMSAIDIPFCYEKMSLSRRHLYQARDWLLTRKTALRSLDALHRACAIDRGDELLTADRLLAKGAKALGVRFRYLGN